MVLRLVEFKECVFCGPECDEWLFIDQADIGRRVQRVTHCNRVPCYYKFLAWPAENFNAEEALSALADVTYFQTNFHLSLSSERKAVIFQWMAEPPRHSTLRVFAGHVCLLAELPEDNNFVPSDILALEIVRHWSKANKQGTV